MDTPDRKNQQQQQQIGTPLSKFEDSPVFNYLNSLSPIKPVKSVHITQTFQSLSFASIPSIFTSPHINRQKETRFLIRHPVSELSKPEISSSDVDGSNKCLAVFNGKLSDCAVGEQNGGNIRCSLNEATLDPPDECPALPNNVSQSVQYDCGSPNHNTSPFETDTKLVMGRTSSIEFVHDGLDERNSHFTSDVELQQGIHQECSKEEEQKSDWENLISDDADDLLVFDSSNESEESKDHVHTLEHDSNHTSILSRLCEDTIDNSQKTQPDDSLVSSLQNSMLEPSFDHCMDIAEQNETDHTPHIFSVGHNMLVSGETSEKIDAGNGDCMPLGNKVDSETQRGMLRRCLVFEMAGSHRNSLRNDSNISSSIMSRHGKFSSDDEHSASLKTAIGPPQCALPSIGLHLNSLASTSKSRIVAQDSLSSGKRLISMPCSISPFPSVSTGQKPPNVSLSVKKDQGSSGGEVQDSQVMIDTTQVPAIGKGDELNHSSPKKKKRKLESGSESEACKRCNCKKSKCLKLYCECFAAGVYCVEPCACQGCLNKPIHEDTVLATRKQIESRNPLAFAPKVIKASEPALEIGEDSIKTPASARHKRGCNCKKSSCLKKYCECYQGGVGCSISCRCEGCKNTFGTKDGKIPMEIEETEHEDEETDACEKDGDLLDGPKNANVLNDECRGLESTLPITPSFQICRPSVKLPFLSSGKPPRSSVLAIGSSPRLNTSKILKKCELPLSQPKFEKHFQVDPEDETPKILRGNASPVSGVKVASPSRKRVSPPHNETGMSPSRKGCRKLVLKSIPSFPSLTSDASVEVSENLPQSPSILHQ